MYKAFISYKHPADEFGRVFISRFESALKRYAKPWFRPPYRIFRDEVNMRPGADLPALIRNALSQSEFLVLLASPEAATSTWVADELRVWFEDLRRSENNLIIVLTTGRITSARDNGEPRIDWEHTNALPPTLASYLTNLPLWIDLSGITREEDLDLANPALKSQVNRIVASFRDLDPEAMLGEEVAQHRRNVFLRNTAISLLAALAIVASLAAIWALRAQDRAERELARTRALLLAANAEREFEHAPQASLAKAMEALRLTERRVPEAESVLRRLVARTRGEALGLLPGPVERIAVSAGGTGIAAAGGKAAFFWVVGKGGELGPARALGAYAGKADCALFSPSGRFFALGTRDGVRVWDIRQGSPTRLEQFETPAALRLEFASDDQWLDVHARDGTMRLMLAPRFERMWRQTGSKSHLVREYSVQQRSAYCGLRWAAVNSDSSLLLREGDEVAGFERLTGSGAAPKPFVAFNDRLVWGGFSSDGAYAAALTHEARLLRFQHLRDEAPPQPLRDVTAAAWFPSSRRVAVARTDHRIEIHGLDGSEPTVLFGLDAEATTVVTAASGILVAGDARGSVLLWRVQDEADVDGSFTLPGQSPRRGASEMPLRGVFRNEGPLIAFAPDLEHIARLVALGSEKRVTIDALRGPPAPRRQRKVFMIRGADADAAPQAPVWAREPFTVWLEKHKARGNAEEPTDPPSWTLDHAIAAARWVVLGRRDLPAEALEILAQRGLDRSVVGQTILAGMSSGDGRSLVLAGSNGRFGIWRRDGDTVALWASGVAKGLPVLRFSDDSRWLAVGDDSPEALLFDLDGAIEPARLPGHGSKVTAMAFSPEGNRVATAGDNLAVLVWDLDGRSTEGEMTPVAFEYAGLAVEELAISPRNRWLVAVDVQWNATVWSLDIESLLRRATRRIAKPLDAQTTHR